MTKNVFTEGNSQEEDLNVGQAIGREIGSMLEHSYALGYLIGQKNGREQGYECGFEAGFERGYEYVAIISGYKDLFDLELQEFYEGCISCPEHGCRHDCKFAENLKKAREANEEANEE